MRKIKVKRGISIGIRIVALVLLLIFFIPTLCVSCQGEKVDVSGFDAATGNVSREAEAAPWLFVIPVLAVVIGILATKFHIVTMICAAANIVMMFIFKLAVNIWVEDYFDEAASYVHVNATTAFSLHIILCLLIILATAFDGYILDNPKFKAGFERLTGRKLEETPQADTDADDTTSTEV